MHGSVSLKKSVRMKHDGRGMESSDMEAVKENSRQYSEADRRDEDKRIKHLRRLVDFSLAYIAQAGLSLDEAHRIHDAVRKWALEMFPGKEGTFDLIYTPRFRRLIAERFRLN